MVAASLDCAHAGDDSAMAARNRRSRRHHDQPLTINLEFGGASRLEAPPCHVFEAPPTVAVSSVSTVPHPSVEATSTRRTVMPSA